MRLQHILSTVAVLSIGISVGLTEPVLALCKLTPEQMGAGGVIGPAELDGYAASPTEMLTRFPKGGPDFQHVVSQFVIRGPASLLAIMSVRPLSNADQRSAMGVGLAQAADLCRTQDPVIVQRIINAVQTSGDRNLQRWFNFNRDDDTLPIGSDGSSLSPGQQDTKTVPGQDSTNWGSNNLHLADPFGSPDDWK